MSDQCGYIIEGPNGAAPGKRPRPWWRRKCLRKAKAGTTPPRCWQHEGLT